MPIPCGSSADVRWALSARLCAVTDSAYWFSPAPSEISSSRISLDFDLRAADLFFLEQRVLRGGTSFAAGCWNGSTAIARSPPTPKRSSKHFHPIAPRTKECALVRSRLLDTATSASAKRRQLAQAMSSRTSKRCSCPACARLATSIYAEDSSLMPVGEPLYDEHLSLFGLYERLSHDAGAHPESMHHRFVLGMSFTLTPDEREALVQKNSKNAERIFPYLGGEEVNTSPTQDFERYVISFGQMEQMELAEAEQWPALLTIVREKVKPERDKNKRDVRRKYWWRFGETSPALYAALAPLKRCLVTARVSKHLLISLQPTDRIFSEQVYVFPLDSYSAFAILQSRIHDPWARLLSSSMKTDLRYSASDCFETFPFPKPDPRSVIPELEAAGQALYDARAKYMVDTQQGLTKTYNALKDPSCDDPRILELRRLHEAMERAVLDAYGWSDIAVPPYCPITDAARRALQAFEDEVIDRLYVLNAERAREEERLGLGKKKAKRAGAEATDVDAADEDAATAAPQPKRGRKKEAPPPDLPPEQRKLFE